MTATEAKTAALQDLNYRVPLLHSFKPRELVSDSMIVVSGEHPDILIRHTGGHTKMGELIGVATKKAVTEALKKHDN
jgi:adenosylcobinamide amidohydrolase